jgi:multiple antibiotic resistance protein
MHTTGMGSTRNVTCPTGTVSSGGTETALQTIIAALVALLAITNPIGAVPVFLEITEGTTSVHRRKDALRASVIVVAILAVSVVAGQAVLGFFGISVDALRAAGGLIIVLMGIEMLGGSVPRLQGHQGGPTTKDQSEGAEDSLVVPFAMPLVAGPGAIATAVTLAAKADSIVGIGETLIAVGAVGVILFVALAASDVIGSHISRRGHAILMRFLGLILTAIGVQYVLLGAQAVLR